jgi:hypothetical protein
MTRQPIADADGMVRPVALSVSMTNLQSEIGRWADETFPDNTPERIAAHLRDEVTCDLNAAMYEYTHGDRTAGLYAVRNEIADIMLLAMSLAHTLGFDVYEAAVVKHGVNRTREWAYDPEVGYDRHV